MNAKKITVLYADDDADDLSIVEAVLKEIAPQSAFVPASDGQMALDLLAQGGLTPDLILLDLNMPRMGGKECLSEIKRNSEWQGIPVVVYTTSSQARDIEATMLSGAACFITKPTHVHAVKEIFGHLVSGLPNGLPAALRRLRDLPGSYIVC